MFWVMLKAFRKQIMYVCFLYIMEGFMRVGASVIMQFLIEAVFNKNISLSYILVGVLLFTNLFVSSVRHNAYYQNPLLTANIRSSLVYVMFKRVSALSQYMVKSTDMGKLINLLAGDFNVMEIKLMFVFVAFTFPIVLLFAAIVLVQRLGWIGLLSLAIPLMMMPIQGLIGKRNGKILSSLNVQKDSRVKTTSEVI